MRWRNYKRALVNNSHSPKPFLVLPLLQKSVNISDDMNRNAGLRLFTKTWPKKTSELNDKYDNDKAVEEYEEERPLTATLERPQVLDPQFIGQIDMSLIRKEFLAINTLCRMPLASVSVNRATAVVRKQRHRTAIIERRRPLPVAISPSEKSKKQRKHESLSEDSWEDESVSSSREQSKRGTRTTPKLRPPKILTPTNRKLQKPSVVVAPVTTAAAAAVEINNNLKPISTKLLPEPCTTCGRPDLPERFHSHPATPLKPLKKLELRIPIPTKNTVQKPVAIKYKSKLIEPKPPEIPMAPIETAKSLKSSAKGPRTLTCYICGREFGTASLPLHEPKCLERWERENKKLPPNLRKKRPVKPDVAMTKEEWNKFAWESAQSQLIPCRNCHRTFLPDRLEVHQRSCKEPQRGPIKSLSIGAISDVSSHRNTTLPHTVPGLVQCSQCGKMFGSKSIKIHEPQCLKKLQKEKEAASSDDQRPSSSSKKPTMFPCYLCGRLFGVNSIYIHEPQCLKKWRAENDKLPLEKRRPIPPKPDIQFTPSGGVDFVGTFNRIWENHLNELRPCPRCGRTFFPNRLEAHQKVCKGF